MSDPELKKYLEDMLEAKLAPVRQMLGRILAAQQDESPRLRDIIGGIGWIIGLLGLAAYMRNRKC
jgi:nickel transport protein